MKARVKPIMIAGYSPKVRELDGQKVRASREAYRKELKKKRKEKDDEH